MEFDAYQRMAEMQERHWWFCGRRAVMEAFIGRLPFAARPLRILDVGCGPGNNLGMLSRLGNVKAMEMNEYARAQARARNPGIPVEPGTLPEQVPYENEQFDLIVMFDVLEHIKDDTASLKALRPRLSDKGRLCLTVPAMPWMWSDRDVANSHYRRYTLKALKRVVSDAGYVLEKISYYNFLLFPAIALLTLMEKAVRRVTPAELTMPRPWVNRLLTTVFSSERHLAGRVRLPFGVSLIMSATKI